MDFFEAAASRYSHRVQFKDTPVPDSDISKIMDAGLRAPSGCNAQTTSFIVITNQGLRSQVASIFGGDAITTAPVIVVAYTKKVTFDFGLDFELEDYGAAVQNILLAATALGYATLWVDGSTRLGGKDAELAKLLNVPKGYQVRTVIPIGVPQNVGNQAPRKPFEERVTWRR